MVGTKGVALVLGEGEALDHLKSHYDFRTRETVVPALEAPKPPVIAVPTTLSSGEFSSAMGITDDETGAKHIFIDPKIVPRVIVLDPVMTTLTPDRLWASTGVKALQNAVERYYALNRHPFIEGLCLEAVRIVFRDLRRSVQDRADLGAARTAAVPELDDRVRGRQGRHRAWPWHLPSAGRRVPTSRTASAAASCCPT